MTQRCVPQEQSTQPHRCENLKTSNPHKHVKNVFFLLFVGAENITWLGFFVFSLFPYLIGSVRELYAVKNRLYCACVCLRAAARVER